MPKVTMYYRPTAIQVPKILSVGYFLRKRLAVMMSTEEVQLKEEDVDFIPIALPKGSLVSAPFSFEIETIGFSERVQKFKDGTLLKILKDQLQEKLPQLCFQTDTSKERLMIWLKYVSPDGPHV